MARKNWAERIGKTVLIAVDILFIVSNTHIYFFIYYAVLPASLNIPKYMR